MPEADSRKRHGAHGEFYDPLHSGRQALSVANDPDALPEGLAGAVERLPPCAGVAARPVVPVEAPGFDVRAMLRNLDDDVELVRELAGFFVASARELLAGMRLALAGGDGGGLARGAHAIKGAAGNFHAAVAVAAAAALETSARRSDFARAAPELAELEAEIARLLPLLEALRDSAPVAGDL